MSLKITKIEIRKFEKDKLKAYVNLTFNDELTIDGFKLMTGEGKHGHWLAPPSIPRKDKNTAKISYNNVIRCTDELKEDILDQVMDEYGKISSSNKPSSEGSYKSDFSRRR